MRNSSPLFYEYVEIRRRIERRLANLQMVMSHVILFAFASLFAYGAQSGSARGTNAGVAFTFALWSLILLGHSLWAYRKSGASAKAREAAINRQIEERLDQHDTDLLSNQRDVFRLHGLFEEDIRKRAGAYTMTMLFLAINAMTWFGWLAGGTESTYPWRMTLPLAFMLLVPATIVNIVRRKLCDNDYKNLFADWSAQMQPSNEQSKPKRTADGAVVRLSDDGELIEEYQADMSKAKRTS